MSIANSNPYPVTITAVSLPTATTSLVVPASRSILVTFTTDATMNTAAPAAGEANYFPMPSFTGVTASVGGSPVTASPATDAWTS